MRYQPRGKIIVLKVSLVMWNQSKFHLGTTAFAMLTTFDLWVHDKLSLKNTRFPLRSWYREFEIRQANNSLRNIVVKTENRNKDCLQKKQSIKIRDTKASLASILSD